MPASCPFGRCRQPSKTERSIWVVRWGHESTHRMPPGKKLLSFPSSLVEPPKLTLQEFELVPQFQELSSSVEKTEQDRTSAFPNVTTQPGHTATNSLDMTRSACLSSRLSGNPCTFEKLSTPPPSTNPPDSCFTQIRLERCVARYTSTP